MYYFLIPLFVGFAFNIASAFTTLFSDRWGQKQGSLLTFILRNILGIPVWATGFVMAVSVNSSGIFESGAVTNIFGWFLILSGAVIISVALVTLRFRAAKPSMKDKIALSGMYAYVRHPIHTGTMLEFAGIFLIFPTLQVAVACLFGIIWVLVQTKSEETDLLKRLPEYREYMNRLPRFFPRLRQFSSRMV